jgi:hypothetical protein
VLFSGAAVRAGRHGLSHGDGRADGAVPRHGCDDDGGGGGRGGGSVVSTMEEEWDNMVPRCGGEAQGGGGTDSAASKRAWEILTS